MASVSPSFPSPEAASFPRTLATDGLTIADVDIVLALRHPAMWRAFVELDAGHRHPALRREPDAIRRLANTFIDWFIQKARQRNRPPGLTPAEYREILRAIAKHTLSVKGTRFAPIDWTTSATGTGIVNQHEARGLLEEAESGGLIDRDGSWRRWRHPFVAEVLASEASDQDAAPGEVHDR